MENITIGEIVIAIGVLSVLIGAIAKVYLFIKKNYSDRIGDLENRVGRLEEKTDMQDKEISESKEERLLLLRGQLACLQGLKQLNCNGEVTEGIKSLEEYMIKKSHE